MLVIADTSGLLALLDADDQHHRALSRAFQRRDHEWLLPGAMLGESDYLIAKHLGVRAQDTWTEDLAAGRFSVTWHTAADLDAAARLHLRHRQLRLGLVDSLVMTMAERLGADAIATLDLRHFGAVAIGGAPQLWPRDL